MIVIQKDTKTKVPKHFHNVNNVCAYIYDQLTEILSHPFYMDMGNSNFDFGDDEELKAAFNNSNDHPLDILHKAERSYEIEIIVTKHVVMSIIADMVNFIYESIIIAQKCKMSVAYALLRKPFTDQLLILEQILADRKDFIDRYYFDGDPQKYDPSARGLDKKAIIDSALAKLGSVVFQSDIIYKLRYDKVFEPGINAFSNHALHIVTNDKSYKTERQGLNFTFPFEDDDINGLFEHYYYSVSILLIYTASVVDKIIFELIENRDGRREEKMFKRFIATMMLYDDEEKAFSKKMYLMFSKMLVTKCEICKHVNKFTKRDFENYFYEHLFYCKKCYNPVNLSKLALEMLDQSLQLSV
ncbi:hypothetical protein ACFQ3S_17015 [Mucilaginibacter terrae]|uniref:hypothetical protein n=1 Tax=Mucilaginibacter terrae TaxID=1955052 RepID=UPI0036253D71